MRSLVRVWLPAFLGVVIVMSVVGFGSFLGVQAQTQAATTSATAVMTASGTAPVTVSATAAVTASATSGNTSAPAGNTAQPPTATAMLLAPCPLSAVTVTVITDTPTNTPTNTPTGTLPQPTATLATTAAPAE